MLAAAGFQMKLADTPERMKKLAAMKQHKFIKVPYGDGTSAACRSIPDLHRPPSGHGLSTESIVLRALDAAG